MNIGFHALINFLIALILGYYNPLLFTNQAIAIITLTAILIDIDHIVHYKLNFSKLLKDFKETNQNFYLFHNIEFIIILAILAYLYQSIIFVLIGAIIHLITDIITYEQKKKTGYLKYLSATHHYSSRKKQI